MRRAALAVALLAAAALVTSAASAPVKAPGYLSETWGNFALFSNTHIKGSKAISPIAAKGAGPNGNLGKPTEPLGPIWLKICPAGVQTVTFERELQLPGPPAGLEVNYGVDRGSSMFPSPLHSIDFVANGKVFLHRPLGEG